MQEPLITVVGHVGAPPRTRVIASGAVVTDFRIASTPRKVDKSTGAVDRRRDDLVRRHLLARARRERRRLAQHRRQGRRHRHLRANVWTTEQGEERSGLEVVAQTVGFDLSRGKAVQERSVPLTLTTDPGGRPSPGAELLDR